MRPTDSPNNTKKSNVIHFGSADLICFSRKTMMHNTENVYKVNNNILNGMEYSGTPYSAFGSLQLSGFFSNEKSLI